ncbi:MAG: heavy metal translocating P-type ATPase [Alphaproteobacteria bacterium]|uniref:P-type Zn(2+) transporter n=1 Tax=Candidatus Nitrobium versatile TaxID=2884831 RepID=A0A953M2M2_9BACT|nr:heavy metal translocating P-type ATPase [Candidatus Nitrobium versatile]
MRYKIIHELPGRIRLLLRVPRRPVIERSRIEALFADREGVERVEFQHRTGSLLVHYNGGSRVREMILDTVQEAPLSFASAPRLRGGRREDRLDGKKRAVIASGSLLLASPFIPAPVRPFLALYGAMPILKKGILSLVGKGRLNIDVLDASAIGVAAGMRDYRTVGVISFLLKLGDYLEEWTRQRSRRMLSSMVQVVDEYAWVRREGREERVRTEEIAGGEIVVVRTGSRIPVDGVVAGGEAMVNQSSMTGESLPVMKRKGVTVHAGTVVEEGTLAVRTTAAGSRTRIARIVKVIEESEERKAEVQNYAERLADRIVPYTFLLSGLTYAFTGNPVRSASVLLVDYSCAIRLSTPLAIMAGMVKAARRGVLIKGGKFVEALAQADVFVLDKTGTLTGAAPAVAEVVPFDGYSREYILRHAACVEEHFPHPVATAVVQKAREEGVIHEEEHGEVEYIVAHGIASALNGRRILIGSRHFISEDEGIDTSRAEEVIRSLAERGLSILYMAIDRELAGIIAIDDPLRDDTGVFLRKLDEAGIKRVIMLTGDNEATARSVAERLGIREYHAQALPDTKAEIIRKLKESGHRVAVVGDGINDSPALALADVGIAMKHGADIAKEASDVLLMDGDLTAIIDAKRVSRTVMSLVGRNFRYIAGINSVLIGLGLSGAISPALSALLHNATTVLVTLNSLSPLAGKDGGADNRTSPAGGRGDWEARGHTVRPYSGTGAIEYSGENR